MIVRLSPKSPRIFHDASMFSSLMKNTPTASFCGLLTIGIKAFLVLVKIKDNMFWFTKRFLASTLSSFTVTKTVQYFSNFGSACVNLETQKNHRSLMS